jgi:hypothetical protein
MQSIMPRYAGWRLNFLIQVQYGSTGRSKAPGPIFQSRLLFHTMRLIF